AGAATHHAQPQPSIVFVVPRRVWTHFSSLAISFQLSAITFQPPVLASHPIRSHPVGLLVPKDLTAAALSLTPHLYSTSDPPHARDDALR
ncbi:MAG TPA: hypothetical protein VEU94_18695, partial [Terriglobales bacterium]|nr:hypothetical protein [Terriglobales bacterium]